MDWIVRRGVEKIPDGVSFERATLVEPVNTCLKAVPDAGSAAAATCVLVLGQGPIGLMFTMLVQAHRRASAGHRHHAAPARVGGAVRRRSRLRTWDPAVDAACAGCD